MDAPKSIFETEKNLKTFSSGQKNPKKPKKTKKKKKKKNLLGWFFTKKPGFFPTLGVKTQDFKCEGIKTTESPAPPTPIKIT
jgi:hypothetical protein